MKTALRPPAVPLITVDPYFSLWSMADALTDDVTRHWTGAGNSMLGLVRVDGAPSRFLGLEFDDRQAGYGEIPAMKQTGLKITATSTKATFTDAAVEFEVTFLSPLLMDDLKLMSRPVAYITFAARSIDGRLHDVSVYLDATGQLTVNDPEKTAAVAESYACAGLSGARIGNRHQQNMLDVTGDNLRIDWGWLSLLPLDAQAKAAPGNAYLRRVFIDSGELDMDGVAWGGMKPEDDRLPLVAVRLELKAGQDVSQKTVMIAYDDFYSIEYFHRFSKAYCYRDGETFEDVIALAAAEYPALAEKCAAFDRALYSDAVKAGGEEYAEILALAYRQGIAAHKLISDGQGNAIFLSKECFSNGCIGTVDVSYPSIPLFLLYNPELVKGMLRPIFRFARSEEWPYDFAPHDVGRYPRANRQVYGRVEQGYAEQWQMPVEECGNMLIMTAAACAASRDYAIARDNLDLIKLWVEYLKQFGADPGNQLCTDDFAGHLAHNTNLSIKAIVGIGAYAQILENLGDPVAAEALACARAMAGKWVEAAGDGACFRLAFDAEDTWSLKYNLLFDRLLGLNLFPQSVVDTELEHYLGKINRYGVPLDSRSAYTKADWLIWCAALAPDKETASALIKQLWRYYHETGSRVPLTDWYDTVTGRYLYFRNRSVVGGLFALLLASK